MITYNAYNLMQAQQLDREIAKDLEERQRRRRCVHYFPEIGSLEFK